MTKSKDKNNVLMIVLLALSIVSLVLVVVNVVLLFINRDTMDELGEDNWAKECLEIEDGLPEDCLDDKAFAFYEEGQCEEALKVYDDIPPERFDKYVLSNLYDEAYSISLSCGDASQEYWSDKLEAVVNQLEMTD